MPYGGQPVAYGMSGQDVYPASYGRGGYAPQPIPVPYGTPQPQQGKFLYI